MINLKPLLVQVAKYCPFRKDNNCRESRMCSKNTKTICCAFCEEFTNLCISNCPISKPLIRNRHYTRKQISDWLQDLEFAFWTLDRREDHWGIPFLGISHKLLARLRGLKTAGRELSEDEAGILESAENRISIILKVRQMLLTFKSVVEQFSPEEQQLIKYKYLDHKDTKWIMKKLNISRATFFRWKKKFTDKLEDLAAKSQL
ncbi:MAG: DUF1492 domain-containing protein [Bacillota bacterium]